MGAHSAPAAPHKSPPTFIAPPRGLGVSLLPELILRRVPYRIPIRRLDTPLYRDIALALPGQTHISAATRRFLHYLDRRDAPETPTEGTEFDN